jgi:hypothetical protein
LFTSKIQRRDEKLGLLIDGFGFENIDKRIMVSPSHSEFHRPGASRYESL